MLKTSRKEPTLLEQQTVVQLKGDHYHNQEVAAWSHFTRQNQDGEEWVNVKQAAGIVWLGVDLHYCWLGKDLHNNAVVEKFRDNN